MKNYCNLFNITDNNRAHNLIYQKKIKVEKNTLKKPILKQTLSLKNNKSRKWYNEIILNWAKVLILHSQMIHCNYLFIIKYAKWLQNGFITHN